MEAARWRSGLRLVSSGGLDCGERQWRREYGGMTRRGVMGLLSSAAVLLLGACGIIKDFPNYRYRLTVEVNTPEGLKTGSSVIEVRWGAVNSTLGGASAEVSGEAAAVDLPGGQTLFALLRSEAQSNWAGYAMFSVMPLPTKKPGQSDSDALGIGIDRIIANKALMVLPSMIKAPVTYAGKQISAYPTLVRFRDIKDPRSVALVDPGNLEQSFGPGVSLRRITVQNTDDPVTTGVEKRFGWWQKFRELHFDGTSTVSEDMTTTELAAHMSPGSFSTEYRK